MRQVNDQFSSWPPPYRHPVTLKCTSTACIYVEQKNLESIDVIFVNVSFPHNSLPPPFFLFSTQRTTTTVSSINSEISSRNKLAMIETPPNAMLQ